MHGGYKRTSKGLSTVPDTEVRFEKKTIEETRRKRGSSVVTHLPLLLVVPGPIPTRGDENFGVRTRFL